MSMPSSGCIALKSCIAGITCSSISCAVTLTEKTPTSLMGISLCGTCSPITTPPYAMRDFYSYANNRCIKLCTYTMYCCGTAGTAYSCACIATDRPMITGSSYNLCFQLWNNACSNAAGSYSRTCIICNSLCLYCVCKGAGTNGYSYPIAFAVDYNDTVVIYQYVYAANPACAVNVNAWANIYNVTPTAGDFSVCTSCQCCLVCTS
jgi:hypothetical protein